MLQASVDSIMLLCTLQLGGDALTVRLSLICVRIILGLFRPLLYSPQTISLALREGLGLGKGGGVSGFTCLSRT